MPQTVAALRPLPAFVRGARHALDLIARAPTRPRASIIARRPVPHRAISTRRTIIAITTGRPATIITARSRIALCAERPLRLETALRRAAASLVVPRGLEATRPLFAGRALLSWRRRNRRVNNTPGLAPLAIKQRQRGSGHLDCIQTIEQRLDNRDPRGVTFARHVSADFVAKVVMRRARAGERPRPRHGGHVR